MNVRVRAYVCLYLCNATTVSIAVLFALPWPPSLVVVLDISVAVVTGISESNWIVSAMKSLQLLIR